MTDIHKVAEILGGNLLRERVRTPTELLRRLQRGLPASTARRVARYVGRSPAEARRVERVVAPRATLERRLRDGQPLTLEESERAERIARLMALAERVLESAEEARAFLQTPHALFGGRPPIELARTDLGARQVEDVLWKLEYSLPV
ncbi:MAG TPA: antitoxin Xre/MbcA/ParS toxin-binding domain-containing protein [Gemmatimonadales bacterium]|nr:antitoxin Xre/MbcA/ParS toxin-binding domain-containing protein [Gemmatimonadales bacterium]